MGTHRGVLFIGGNGPSENHIAQILRREDLIYAADSGFDAAIRCGIRPSYLVGDMDSLAETDIHRYLPPEKIEIHPEDKDRTDTEIGIERLRDAGCSRIVLIGGGEGRLDHTLALMSLFNGTRPPDLWFTSVEEVRSIEGFREERGRVGDVVSYFPAGSGPWEILSNGLKWRLGDLAWDRGDFSLSNRFESARPTVEVRRGRLVQIRPIVDALDAAEEPIR